MSSSGSNRVSWAEIADFAPVGVSAIIAAAASQNIIGSRFK